MGGEYSPEVRELDIHSSGFMVILSEQIVCHIDVFNSVSSSVFSITSWLGCFTSCPLYLQPYSTVFEA